MTRSLLLLLLVFPALTGVRAAEVPNVLVLGDPMQRNLFSYVSKELKGKARINFPNTSAYDTGTALAAIDDLIGDRQWDLIYFNFGLGDLFYKDPRSEEIRIMSKNSGGVRVTPPEQYRKNLEALVTRLKATKAKLIWASTTPLVNVNSFPAYQGNVYDPNSEIEYNEIAATIMRRQGVPVLDLHSFIMKQFGPEEKHPGHDGYLKALMQTAKGKPAKTPLHQPVVQGILAKLD